MEKKSSAANIKKDVYAVFKVPQYVQSYSHNMDRTPYIAVVQYFWLLSGIMVALKPLWNEQKTNFKKIPINVDH